MNDVFKLGDKISLVPVVHASADFALEIRRILFENFFDCLAVPLPASFQEEVESAIDKLPQPTMVVQGRSKFDIPEWSPERDREEEEDEEEMGDEESGEDDEDEEEDKDNRLLTYVPIDPCQAVIMALRMAMGQRISREFIDLESAEFTPLSAVYPDPYCAQKCAAGEVCRGDVTQLASADRYAQSNAHRSHGGAASRTGKKTRQNSVLCRYDGMALDSAGLFAQRASAKRGGCACAGGGRGACSS